MARYALLIRPAANRVFGGVAASLARAELIVADRLLFDGALSEVTVETIAGVEYVTFTSHADFSATTLPAAVVANSSSAYALFEVGGGGRMVPVELHRLDRFDEDLVTTQRYAGKTNETLTKLLLNLGLFTAEGAFTALVGGGSVRVLDPLCGRGTTLNQALLYGCDALGVDNDVRDTQAYGVFLRTWLEDKRLKHQSDRAAGGNRMRVTIGSKSRGAAGPRSTVDVATADTAAVVSLFGRNAVDVVAADLPYGVQHGSRADAGVLARSPGALLERALPEWRRTLRPGGGLVLSWNLRVLDRGEMSDVLTESGFSVVDLGERVGFEHRVDRSITRDLVVAQRPVS